MGRDLLGQISHDKLNMLNVCAKMVPKNLSLEPEYGMQQICVDILRQIESEQDLLEKVMFWLICDEICDETWTPKLRGSSYIGRLHQNWIKLEWTSQNWRPWWSYFSILRVLLWQNSYLKDKLLINIITFKSWQYSKKE